MSPLVTDPRNTGNSPNGDDSKDGLITKKGESRNKNLREKKMTTDMGDCKNKSQA